MQLSHGREGFREWERQWQRPWWKVAGWQVWGTERAKAIREKGPQGRAVAFLWVGWGGTGFEQWKDTSGVSALVH